MSEKIEKNDVGNENKPLDMMQVSPELVAEISNALRNLDNAQIDYLLEPLHSADVADIFEQLHGSDRKMLASYIGPNMDPVVLAELEDSALDDVMNAMDDLDIANAVTQMETDDAIHVLEDMDEVDQRKIIDALPQEDRLAIEEGLSFPEYSAGRLSQRSLVSVPGLWSVGKVIDYFRTEKDLPEEFYEIFVVDPMHHPIGTVALNKIIRNDREKLISEIMDTDPKVVPVDMDQEEVAYIFRQYDLASMGVVDNDGRLVGMIMVDDIVDVIDDEAEEDFMYMAGVHETDITESVYVASKNRVVWLLVNLLTAILASMVIALFDASIEQMVALAVLMPIVASMGGNAGTQTMTVTVRALATRELTSSNAKRVVFREFAISVVNGVIIAVVIGVMTWAWFQNLELGGVMGIAMVVNIIMAGLAGILIPIMLDKMKIDPALASSIFVTTVTDVVGFFAFLGLAALVLL
jgi:magnesium transporter